MKTSEFKAWFAGYVENLDGPPNKKQWKRIQARVDEIDGVAVTEHVFIDRYWRRYPTWETFRVGDPVVSTCQSVSSNEPVQIFNSTVAMTSVGSADAAFDSHEGNGGIHSDEPMIEGWGGGGTALAGVTI